MKAPGEWGPPCTVRGCQCTHTGECDRGWVDYPATVRHGITYQRVAPCAVCRPDAFTRWKRDLDNSRNLT